MPKNINIEIDYDKSILALSNSILKYFNCPHKYKSLEILDKVLDKKYQNVVLMIIDGMGANVLEKTLSEKSFLRQHVISNISSVFPSTTAAATTAYHSGLPPLASGWLGWMCYFPQYDKIIELFRNKEYYTGRDILEPPVSETFIKYEPIYTQITKVNPDVEYHRIFPDFEENGCCSFAEECERVIKESRQNNKRKIFAVYWTEPDHSIHEFGVESIEAKKIMDDINDNLEKMYSQLKDTIVIISADHGIIDTQQIYLNDYPDLCKTFLRPPSLESRFVNFFIKPGQQAVFEKLFYQYFDEDFILYKKQEFLSSGILGHGNKHPLVDDFLGEYQTIAIGKRCLHYSTDERALKLFKAEHAGVTPAEMTVPLIVLKQK